MNKYLEEMYSTPYKLYFLFSPENVAPIWIHSQWSGFSKQLRKEAKYAAKPISVKSEQMEPDERGYLTYRKFGKLGLTTNGDEKWCPKSENDFFRNTKISIPSLKKCEILLSTPELFITVMNRGSYLGFNFSSVLLLAFSQEKHGVTGEILHPFNEQSLVSNAKAIMRPFLMGTKNVTWGMRYGDDHKRFSPVNSLWLFDLFPNPYQDDSQPSRAKIEAYWDTVDVLDFDLPK